MEDVRTAIAASNVNQPKGSFDGTDLAYSIASNDQLLSSDEYRPLIVAYRNGAPVRLSDVADVIDDTENVRQAAWMNTTPAIILNIQRRPATHHRRGRSCENLLPQLRSAFPASVNISVLTDRTLTIRASVKMFSSAVAHNRAVVMVIFLFAPCRER
jgi:multidrug efflux pump